MKHTILVTGTGAIIGYGIIESLRRASFPVKIVAIDIYDHAYGKQLADVFYKGVLGNSEEFTSFVNDIIEKEKVDLIIPGIEQDLYAFHKNLDKLKCPVVMNNSLCIELSKNKLDTYQYLKAQSDLTLIPTLFDVTYVECVSQLGTPFLLKPLSSYASKGIETIRSEEEFDFYSKKIGHKCIYQKIIGSADEEFTISVFGNGAGNFLDHIILKRYLSQEGATSRAEVVESETIIRYVSKLVSVLKPVGPTNIQLRMENGVPYLLEINPRISSACSIRTFFGYNEPEMCIKYFITHDPVKPAVKKKGAALRFISDHIVYE
jgi:carbamoyl-phosphate synthase large subunit